ncbi:MAG: hypothetical protein M1281_07675 [Chloroflexi bacterium]|nr:hypothetical protein [Chloroflexota bacterium]
MKPKSYAHILDDAIAACIPDTIDLTPRILARIDLQRRNPMQPRLKLATIIILVIATVLALSTVAYAVYRWMGDSGLQSVQDAGLVTNIDVTARPTVLPTRTPSGAPQPAAALDLSQTLEGVTLTLDWAYLDEGRLALGWTTSALPPDLNFDLPRVTFEGINPAPMQGWSQSLRADQNHLLYVSYQVVQSDAVHGKVNLAVDVPVLRAQSPVASFHYDLKDLPVYRGQAIPLQQTRTVTRNGVEVRLRSVRVTPSFTEVVACYNFPTQTAPFWYMQSATVQFGDGPEEGYRPYQYLSEIQDDHCVKLGFAAGDAGGEKQMVFRVHELVVPLTMQDVLPPERIAAANQELAQYGIEIKSAPAEQSEGPGGWQFVRKPEGNTDPAKDPNLLVLQTLEEKMEGPWEFYVDIPSANIVPGEAALAPTTTPARLGEKSISGVTMSLDWVFADVKRVAFGFTITGLPDVPDAITLPGRIEVKDGQGNPLGGWGGSTALQRVSGEGVRPGTLQGTWSALVREPLNTGEQSFSIDVTLDGSHGSDANNTIMAFDTPPDATPIPSGVVPPALLEGLVGTFHFEARATVYPLQVLEPAQAVTENGISIRLERAELTPSYAQFTLCYAKPSAKDWMIGQGTTLTSGAYEANIHGYTLLGDADLGGYVGKGPQPTDLPEIGAGERCVQIDFLLGHTEGAQSLTLTIPTLQQSGPEVIPDAEIQVAQEKLKADGIEMDYLSSSSTGGGGSGPVFTKKPEGMSDQEVYQLFMEALGYFKPGPWVFTIEAP